MSHSQNWQPTASIETLKRRAQLLADVRLFFAQRGVLEVDTPILSSAAPTAPYLASFETRYLAEPLEETLYLQTSPEFAMKRLLAAGMGDIYQICKAFRNGERGRHHSSEFTLLEWYRPALNYHALMDEVSDVLEYVAAFPAALRMTYQSVFETYLDINPHSTPSSKLREICLSKVIGLPKDWDADQEGWLELLMSELIEPELAKLQQPVIVYDFPASQAQLAKCIQNQQGQTVAARFELYFKGLELANGYDELLNADELRQRFKQDNLQRQKSRLEEMPIDEKLLAAMEAGLPQCTGVALGLDRLMMTIIGESEIRSVTAISDN